MHANRYTANALFHFYIFQYPTRDNVNHLEILKSQDDSRYLSWDIEKYKNGTERWLCIYWRASENNFESIRDLILEKASLLDVIEKTLR